MNPLAVFAFLTFITLGVLLYRRWWPWPAHRAANYHWKKARGHTALVVFILSGLYLFAYLMGL